LQQNPEANLAVLTDLEYLIKTGSIAEATVDVDVTSAAWLPAREQQLDRVNLFSRFVAQTLRKRFRVDAVVRESQRSLNARSYSFRSLGFSNEMLRGSAICLSMFDRAHASERWPLKPNSLSEISTPEEALDENLRRVVRYCENNNGWRDEFANILKSRADPISLPSDKLEEIRKLLESAIELRVASPTPDNGPPAGLRTQEGTIIEIVLNKFPQPNAITSWQAIEEFRNDPNTRVSRMRLREWVADMATKSDDPAAVARRLDYLLTEYEEHMRKKGIATTRGTFATIAISIAEIASDVAKINWGKVTERLFQVTQRKTPLLLEESSAPGREVAYVAHARLQFDSDTGF